MFNALFSERNEAGESARRVEGTTMRTDRHDEVEATGAQLTAMGAARFEVGVKRADGRLLPLVLTPDGIMERRAWLERENGRGADVFVRPEGSIGLVLVDDLDVAAVDRLVADELTPAVVVETSPANHQVWVRLSAAPLAPALATAAARELAARYGGDPNSAAWRHYGRLVGFTNRKPKHRRADGTYPTVRLVTVTGGIAPAAGSLLDVARRRWTKSPGALHRSDIVHRMLIVPRRAEDEPLSPLGDLYRKDVERLAQRYPALDASRLDWMITLSLARAFADADAAELARAMVEGSPSLRERKSGHMADYVSRTVSKALAVAAAERGRGPRG